MGAHFVYPEVLLHRPYFRLQKSETLVSIRFIGSGTTAVVVKKLGRRFLGCDINPEYVRIAEGRLQSVVN